MANVPATLQPKEQLDGIGGPGQGNLRIPFVDLFILGTRIPLLDSGRDVPGPPLPGQNRVVQAVEKPLLLVDFRYYLKSKIGAANNVSMTIIDPNWDYLENLMMANLKARGEFTFEYGWRQDSNVRQGARISGLLLRSYTVTYLPFQGARIQIDAVDKTVQMSFERLTRAFGVTQKISSIIRSLISEVDGVECDVEEMEQVVGPEHNRMENQTRIEYIMHLLEVAKSQSTSGADFIAKVIPAGPTSVVLKIFSDIVQNSASKTFIVGRERQGRMIDFSPSVLGSVLLSMGGGKAIATGVDGKTKNIVKVTTTDNDDLTTHPERVNPTPNEAQAVYELPLTRPSDIEGFVKGMRGRIDKVAFNATATLLGDTSMEPFKHINIVVLKSNVPGQATRVSDKDVVHVSGYYRIKTVEHIIQPGMFRTLITLYRESGFAGAGKAGKQIPISFDIQDETDLVRKIVNPLELQQLDGQISSFSDGVRKLTGFSI